MTEADGWTFKRVLVDQEAMSWSSCKGLQVPVKWHKSLAGVCKAQMHLMLGFEGVFSVWSELQVPLLFHLCYNHEEVLMWFVQMLFGCLSRGTGKGLAQPCPPSPSLYTVGQHLGTSGVIAALIPSSSWTGHLWMQNTEEIESWVIFTVLLLASAL